MTEYELAAKIRDVLEWFLALNPVEHLEGCYLNHAFHVPLIRLACRRYWKPDYVKLPVCSPT